MMDLTSGEMKMLNAELLKDLPTMKPEQFMDCEKFQQAKDEAQPNRAMQGPVFMEGEILVIRGGRFKIRKINHWGLVLDSMAADFK
jgi:hypothetical protein